MIQRKKRLFVFYSKWCIEKQYDWRKRDHYNPYILYSDSTRLDSWPWRPSNNIRNENVIRRNCLTEHERCCLPNAWRHNWNGPRPLLFEGFFEELFDDLLDGVMIDLLDGAIDGLEVVIALLPISIINVLNRLKWSMNNARLSVVHALSIGDVVQNPP